MGDTYAGHIVAAGDTAVRHGASDRLDVTDPSAPREVGTVKIGGAADSVEGLVVIDVSPPTDPQQVLRTVRVGSGDYRDVAVRNGYAYVADAPEEPYILRTEALTAPKQSTP